jgi:peroxiredoxin
MLLRAALLVALVASEARAERPQVEDFALLDQHGNFHQLSYYSDAKAIVLFVQGNGCPIARNAIPVLSASRERFEKEGVVFLMLNANLQDDRRSVAAEAGEFDVEIPILIDETQLVARGLDIARTAEVLVIDPATWRIVYRGPVDDRLSYETQKPAAKEHLRDALEDHLAGREVATVRREPRGCLISYPDENLGEPEPITYEADVAPVLKRRCRSCHHEGGVAPWAMTDYAMVRGWSAMMREVIRTRRMPPWHADPHIGHFANDISLTNEEKRTLVRWIEAGARRGPGPDPLVQEPHPARDAWALGKPDLIVEVPTQKIPATGVIPYRYETVALALDEDVWLRAVDIQPGNPRVMHHGTAYIVPPGGQGPEPVEGPRFVRGLFAGYVPGRNPEPFPEDAGFLLPAGSRIRFQLHYSTTGRPETDAPRLALYFAPEPRQRLLKIGAAGNMRFQILPRSKAHRESAVEVIDQDIVLYRLTPHMHFRGRAMRYEAQYPDGTSEVLLSVPHYNFNWQRQYVLAQPKRIPAGTRLVVDAVFDNSSQNPANPDPGETVEFGEQSWDEMLFGYFLYGEPASAEAALTSR